MQARQEHGAPRWAVSTTAGSASSLASCVRGEPAGYMDKTPLSCETGANCTSQMISSGRHCNSRHVTMLCYGKEPFSCFHFALVSTHLRGAADSARAASLPYVPVQAGYRQLASVYKNRSGQQITLECMTLQKSLTQCRLTGFRLFRIRD